MRADRETAEQGASRPGEYLTLCLAVGAGLGGAVGAGLGGSAFATSVGLGVGVGTAIGAALDTRRKRQAH
jgi:hypothetical protein